MGDFRLHSARRPAYRPVPAGCENRRCLRGPRNVASLRLDCGSLGDGDLIWIFLPSDVLTAGRGDARRIAFLAGVSIAERVGPEIVPELQRRTIGTNRVLFAKIAAGIINQSR